MNTTKPQYIALQIAYTNGKYNNKQFCTPKIPYWKTYEYKKQMGFVK